jgi:hypothetical protein
MIALFWLRSTHSLGLKAIASLAAALNGKTQTSLGSTPITIG